MLTWNIILRQFLTLPSPSKLNRTLRTILTWGIANSELQENNNAIDDYTNAINLKPDFAFAYANRGIIYLNLGYQEDACKDFTKALELGDTEIKSYAKKYCQ